MKLLIADDHTLFCDALEQYIRRAEPDTEIIRSKDFYGALEALQAKHVFDLVLLDLRMPGMNGLEGLKTVITDFPSQPVALMSGLAENHDIEESLAMGARGFFAKTLSGKDLIKGIRTIMNGQIFAPKTNDGVSFLPSHYDDSMQIYASTAAPKDSSSSTYATQHYQNDDGADIHSDDFTDRERDIMDGLLQGHPNKVIAQNLGVQEVTVKLHVSSVCRKLGVHNRTQAALKIQEKTLNKDTDIL